MSLWMSVHCERHVKKIIYFHFLAGDGRQGGGEKF